MLPLRPPVLDKSKKRLSRKRKRQGGHTSSSDSTSSEDEQERKERKRLKNERKERRRQKRERKEEKKRADSASVVIASLPLLSLDPDCRPETIELQTCCAAKNSPSMQQVFLGSPTMDRVQEQASNNGVSCGRC